MRNYASSKLRFLAHFHNITFSKHGGDENGLCSVFAETFPCFCTLKCQFDGCWMYYGESVVFCGFHRLSYQEETFPSKYLT